MISGSLVALVTPMRHNGEVDWPALAKLVDWHIEAGTSGIVAVGTTGESATLDVEEHIAVVRHVVDQVRGRILVIAGTGANSTKEAIELTQAAKDVKADACLLVTPYYNKPTQEGLFLHHKAIADAVAIPQILYNVPGRTACDMQAETVERLSKVNHIVGIKEATGNIERGKEIVARCRKDFALCSGDDATFVDLMAIGAQGNISVTANIAPKQMADICRAALQGDFLRARELNSHLAGLHKHLFCEANPIPVKWAMWKMGLMEDGIRLPLTVLSERCQPVVVEALQTAGLING